MHKTTFLFSFLLIAVVASGQMNPVNNLNHWQQYLTPNNFYELSWEEPTAPHDELLGYNIYRENELYLFHTGSTNLFHLPQGSNDYSLLEYNLEESQGYYAHVTAVYTTGESEFVQTVYVAPPALKTQQFAKTKAILYPNPTNGILHIGNENLDKIVLFDVTGKQIKEFQPQPQIDLSELPKGLYLIKLFSAEGIWVDKIIVE
ncbi:T9SS type A sorting domain-containing protein [Flavobacterium sp.]|uniref:T9SS type A sorting domain-containing protein n=1 Tax=Flavobacterium sp. TaxID=239 RepID=UPI0039E61129